MLRRMKIMPLLALLVALVACDEDATAPILPPGGVTAAATSATSVVVAFATVSGSSSYTIERAAGTGSFAPVGTTTTGIYTDNTVQPNTTYRYRVAAVRGTGTRASTGPYSAEVTVTTPVDVLPGPTGIDAIATSRTAVTVTWEAVTGATLYNVERAGATGAFASIGTSTSTTYVDTEIAPSTEYRYRVQGLVGSQATSFSAEAAVTTQALTNNATISSDITASRTLYADTVYTLQGFIHVGNGATLTIEPGT
ncbi:MAG: hypothetical protein WD054_01890, partial [Gemmatimonadota bacterium]